MDAGIGVDGGGNLVRKQIKWNKNNRKQETIENVIFKLSK